MSREPIEKLYVDGAGLVADSFDLAYRIWRSGFVPDVLVALWRGGTPIGVAVHEFLDFKGIRTVHTVLKAGSYTGIGMAGSPAIEVSSDFLSSIPRGAATLLVDDIFDSGRTIDAVCAALRERTDNFRIATLYWKPAVNATARRPDYFLHETDRWVVFPHELVGLTEDDIRRKGERIYEIVTRPAC